MQFTFSPFLLSQQASAANTGPIFTSFNCPIKPSGVLICAYLSLLLKFLGKREHYLAWESVGMSNDNDRMSNDEYHHTGNNRSHESARDITDHLLQSPSAPEALGWGLLPALSPLMSQQATVHRSLAGPSSATASQVSSNIPSTHVQQPFNPP